MINNNFNQTITLYNKLMSQDSSDEGEHFFKTVLKKCSYSCSISAKTNTTEETKSSSYVVRIEDNGLYKAYNDWVKLSDDDKKKYFTVSLDDIVILGDCEAEIGSESVTATSLLKNNKPNAFRIAKFKDNTNCVFAKHFRVEG